MLAFVEDRANKHDPTGTDAERKGFRKAAKVRLRQWRAALHTAVLDHDILALKPGSFMGYQLPAIRQEAFHAWLASEGGQRLGGTWAYPYINTAWQRGLADAEGETGTIVPAPPSPDAILQLLKVELSGIIAATVQQVARVAVDITTTRAKPAVALRRMFAVFDKVATIRLLAMANTLTVKAYNYAKAEVYRTVGIERVGIIPETLPRDGFRDVDIEAILAPWTEEPLWGSQTAEDWKVCEKCLKIEDNAPYELGDILEKLPAHVNCRCAIVPWKPDVEDAKGWGEKAREASLEVRRAGAHHQLERSTFRAYSGRPKQTKTQLTKRETGQLGEALAASYMRSIGYKDTRPVNHEHENFPVDMIQDHELLEVKTGVVSSVSPRWRATIGQPSANEAKWLARASPEAKRAHNEKKHADILARKEKVLQDYSKKLGVKFKGRTVGLIIDPDMKVVDIYLFEGFHREIRWTSAPAKEAYVGSYKYKG